MSDHVLLTVLGTNPSSAEYQFGEQRQNAKLAPIALFHMLPAEERPNRILALCTPEAKETSWPELQNIALEGCEVEPIDLPTGHEQKHIDEFLSAVARVVPSECELTVDVTHGFRHFSFLTYVSVLYLQALRSVKVKGAWYGLLNRDRPSPFLDLRPLVHLPQWIHAIHSFKETGSAIQIANILEGDIAQDLKAYSDAYLSGLPLELGRQARKVCKSYKPLKQQLRSHHSLPLSDALAKEIVQPLSAVAIEPEAGNWKAQVQLCESELKRQAELIDALLKQGSYSVALRLMSEWAVSWVAWRRDERAGWLDYDLRMIPKGLLAAMDAVSRDKELRGDLTEEQRNLGCFWHQLSKLRNGFAHHGMRPQVLAGKDFKRDLDEVLQYWRETLRRFPDFCVALGGAENRRVLISPIGKRPGVLFSALQEVDHAHLDLCFIICSSDTLGLIDDVTQHAGFRGESVPLMLEDPFGGEVEIKRLVKEAQKHFIGADEVLVNVTGGTTLMGIAAERLASKARALACPSVRRFGLIDRRSPSDQEQDPYKMGEAFCLDTDDDRY